MNISVSKTQIEIIDKKKSVNTVTGGEEFPMFIKSLESKLNDRRE
jgi:hypothetical protein